MDDEMTIEEYLEEEASIHGSCGHEDDCPSGCEDDYNRGF